MVHPNYLSSWRLNLEGKVRRVAKDRIYAGRHALSFGQVRRFYSSFRMPEARSIEQHLFLLSPCQVRESLWCSRTLEGKRSPYTPENPTKASSSSSPRMLL